MTTDPAGLVHRLLTDRPALPRVLGLGEPTHGVETFPLLRNTVFEHLVEHAGYRTIALESDAWAGRLVDAWVRGAADTTEDDVLARGLTHGFGASPANRALLRWARERNAGLPPAEQVRVTGFDAPWEIGWAPSPRETLAHLHAFVRDHGDVPWNWADADRLLGTDAPWTEPMAMLDPARSVGSQDRVRELRALADDLVRALACAAPELRRAVGYEDAELAGRTATALLAYHACMARPSDDRAQRLCALRDLLEADHVTALARRGPVLLFAHHQHLRTGTATMAWGGVTILGVDVPATTLRWQPAGAHLADRFGVGYAAVATATGRPRLVTGAELRDADDLFDADLRAELDAVLVVADDGRDRAP